MHPMTSRDQRNEENKDGRLHQSKPIESQRPWNAPSVSNNRPRTIHHSPSGRFQTPFLYPLLPLKGIWSHIYLVSTRLKITTKGACAIFFHIKSI